MKQKRKFQEYITRDELENTYNYQRKVFNSKIEEINQIIDKIQECFSLRFGEDLSNSRYDRQIEEIKYNLNQIENKNISQINEIIKSVENAVDEKLNEFKFKNQEKLEEDRECTKNIIKEEIERFYEDVNKKIVEEEELKNQKLKQLNESIKYTEEKNIQLNKNIEEYVKNFKDQLKDIGRDGRSRTAIGRLQKTIQDIKDNKEEVEGLVNTKVEDIHSTINQIETNLKASIENKVEKENYKSTIENLKYEIKGIEQLIIINKKESNEKIEELNESNNKLEELNESTQNKLEKLKDNIQNKLEELDDAKENLKTDLIQMQNKININIEENEKKLEQVEYYFQNQIKENIKDLDYEQTIKKIQDVENCINQIKQENNQMQINNNDVIEQMQAVLSIVAGLEDKLNKSGVETLTEDVGKIIDRQINFIQNKYEKLFEQKLKAFERNIKVHEKMLENKMLQGRIQTSQTMKKTNTMPTQNYNVVTFQNSKPSNIYDKIQNTNTQIKQSAQSNIIYDERQTYLQEAINKLKTQEEISKQIRNTGPRKNQILFDFDVEE